MSDVDFPPAPQSSPLEEWIRRRWRLIAGVLVVAVIVGGLAAAQQQRTYVIVHGEAGVAQRVIASDAVSEMNAIPLTDLQDSANLILEVPSGDAARLLAALNADNPSADIDLMANYRSLLTAVPESQVDDPATIARLRALREVAGERDVQLVRTPPNGYGQNLLRAAGSGRFGRGVSVDAPGQGQLSLPSADIESLGNTLRFRALSPERQDQELSVLAPAQPEDGYLALSGTLYTPEGDFRVESLGRDGLHVLIRMPATESWNDHPSEDIDDDGGDSGDEGDEDFDGATGFHTECSRFDDHVITIGWFADRPTYVDALLAQTSGAPKPLTDAIKDLNDSLRLHGVNTPQHPNAYRFELVALLNGPFRDQRGLDLAHDGAWLAHGERPEYDPVWAAARERNIDLVLQVVSYEVNHDVPEARRVCGYSPNRRSARALVVDLACLHERRNTLQHEVGHKFGAAHDRECCPASGCSGTPTYRYDWRSPNSAEGTFMTDWKCQQVPQPLVRRYHQYSDPNVLGRGTANQRDVARLIRERIAAVAGLGRCGVH